MSAPQPDLHVAVLGAGSWGTALAVLASRQHDTLLWARNPDTADAINTLHENKPYLAGISLPPALRATAHFDQALRHVQTPSVTSGLIILGVPVSALEETCRRLSERLPCDDTVSRLSVVWTCKGLHPQTSQLAHQTVQSQLDAHARHGLGLGVLSGPSFAHEVAQGLPVALTIATHNLATIDRTTRALHGEAARIYSSDDIIGVEIGGALKNIMAIACGISDGLKLGNNARAALITRGLAEIQRLGLALGGRADTFAGLTGLGDLVLTATGDLSRNRQVGLAIGQGRKLDDILANGMTAEGVRCVRAALELGQRLGVDLPITDAVYQVLFNGLPPHEAVARLLARDAKPETSTAFLPQA